MLTHTIKEEHEHVREFDGTRWYTVHCSCGTSFTAPFRPGLTPRRTAQARWRKHERDTAILNRAMERAR